MPVIRDANIINRKENLSNNHILSIISIVLRQGKSILKKYIPNRE